MRSMRSFWLLFIGEISTVLANPVPGPQSSDQVDYDSSNSPQEFSTDEYTFGDGFTSIPNTNGNDNRIALGNVEDGNSFYGITADSADQSSPEGVNGYEIASEWWMSGNDKIYADFQCGKDNSVCCTKTIIGPLTRSVPCSQKQGVTPLHSPCLDPQYFHTCKSFTDKIKNWNRVAMGREPKPGETLSKESNPATDNGVLCYSDCEGTNPVLELEPLKEGS